MDSPDIVQIFPSRSDRSSLYITRKPDYGIMGAQLVAHILRESRPSRGFAVSALTARFEAFSLRCFDVGNVGID